MKDFINIVKNGDRIRMTASALNGLSSVYREEYRKKVYVVISCWRLFGEDEKILSLHCTLQILDRKGIFPWSIDIDSQVFNHQNNYFEIINDDQNIKAHRHSLTDMFAKI